MRRLAIPADLDRVFDIHMHEAVMPFLGFDPMPREAFSRVFDPLFESGCFYVFEVEGRVQGFYQVQRYLGHAAHVAHLGTLAVAPEAHGTGVAAAMMEDALSRLRRAGVTRVELAVAADNPRAIAFYERFGFAHEGTQRAACKRAFDEAYVDARMYGLLLSE